jgi:uncharacterized protein
VSVPKRNEYPAGAPCWIDTAQPDPGAAVDFYGGLFDWKFENMMPPDSPQPYLMGRLDGLDVAAIVSLPETLGAQAVWATYVCVESTDATARRRGTPEEGSSPSRSTCSTQVGMAVLADPAEAAFCIWQPRSHAGAERSIWPALGTGASSTPPIRKPPNASTGRYSDGRP